MSTYSIAIWAYPKEASFAKQVMIFVILAKACQGHWAIISEVTKVGSLALKTIARTEKPISFDVWPDFRKKSSNCSIN